MRQRVQGFSLLEVLVAFVILALTLGVLMRLFSGVLNNIGTSSGYSQALVLAESKIAAMGVVSSLEPGETSGAEAQGYAWRIVVKPYSEAASGQDSVPISPELFEIEVHITWQDASSKPRILKLTTLRVQGGP